MTVLGVYLPGDSVVHRTPAGVKMLALVAGRRRLVSWRHAAGPPSRSGCGAAVSPWPASRSGVAVRAAAAVAFRRCWSGSSRYGRRSWVHAVRRVGVLTALLLLATLISLTTPTAEIVQAVVVLVRPLRRFGVDPDRVGLLLALGIRAVPLVVGLAEEIRDAQRARGLTAGPRAFAVPLIVRSLRQADALGDALRARGIDD